MPPTEFSLYRQNFWQQLPAQALAADSLRHLQSQYALGLDQVLIKKWQHFPALVRHAALCAVGGYGRTELYPHSDIDVLCLMPAEANPVLHEEWQAL